MGNLESVSLWAVGQLGKTPLEKLFSLLGYWAAWEEPLVGMLQVDVVVGGRRGKVEEEEITEVNCGLMGFGK